MDEFRLISEPETFMKKKSILITGINGFLGSRLARELSGKYRIIGLDINIGNLFRLKNLPVKVYDSELGDFDKIFKENQFFAIIHVATVYRKENEEIEKLLDTNIILPAKLISLVNKFNVPLFINTDSFFNRPGSKYTYLADYTLSKQHAFDWLSMLKGSCKLVNLKIHHMYGPDDAPAKFVPSIISSLKSNQPHINLTAGEQKRDFIFIDDVVDAYAVILEQFQNLPDGIFECEVGTGKAVVLKEFIKMIKELTQSTTELRFGALPYREGEIMEAEADNRALVDLGWKPVVDLDQGLKLTIDNKTVTK